MLKCAWGFIGGHLEKLFRLKGAVMSEFAPGLLAKISERYFGWYTSDFSRDWEYKWAAEQLQLRHGEVLLDAGTGKSPLPFYFAEQGVNVITVDSDSAGEGGECGYFDYGQVLPQMRSNNSDFTCMRWLDTASVDALVSISVIQTSRQITDTSCLG